MAIRYPNGKKFQPKRIPSAKKSDYKKDSSFSNRGMRFEERIEESNEFYLSRGFAVIHKKPTPLQIVNVHYPKRSAAVVTEAYFQKPSTTDFNGVYKGFHLDFEAKETRNKQSFPLKNFHEHQLHHMRAVTDQGGKAFVLVHFSMHEEVFLIPASIFIAWTNNEEKRKSIPKSWIEESGFRVSQGFMPSVDYLSAVDEWLSL
ncbi:Holliday junction resolvase RecU [Alkalicoccus luteus]|uniref:Holliday junction resolvase RecU n=1 Tax=Alkalicoccus luteus TaxID=1237094 RepID=A0A969PSW1_9BACI|nr:Holliday junction resolvase RecU [Alkalicoccus luteus]NJP38895.1 Holliday junction resolvase RecU [Alkalicoccus luteus]